MMGLEVHGNLTENGRRITAMNSTQHCSALCCTPLKNTMFHCVVFLLAQCFTVRYSSVHDEQCTEMCGIIVSQLCAQCTATNYTALSFSALFTLLHCTVRCVLVLCKHCTMHCNKLHCTSMYYSTVQWCSDASLRALPMHNALQCITLQWCISQSIDSALQCITVQSVMQWCISHTSRVPLQGAMLQPLPAADIYLTAKFYAYLSAIFCIYLFQSFMIRCCNLYQLLIYI